jgi:hypothetical protein
MYENSAAVKLDTCNSETIDGKKIHHFLGIVI